MLIVLQRVTEARVEINQHIHGAIQHGLMILCGFEQTDTSAQLEQMLEKVLHYRIFSDENGKMNRALKEIEGGLLLVPQFTLVADTKKGLRPSFSKGASPELGKKLFTELVARAKEKYSLVSCGQFGADMQVYLCNDGPVTFTMQF